MLWLAMEMLWETNDHHGDKSPCYMDTEEDEQIIKTLWELALISGYEACKQMLGSTCMFTFSILALGSPLAGSLKLKVVFACCFPSR